MGFLRVLLGSALWASWALPLYTPCALRGALRFFLMKFLLTYQKKKNLSYRSMGSNVLLLYRLYWSCKFMGCQIL
jgi:hypothetical protein